MKITRNVIKIHPDYINAMSEEFSVSKMSIYQALNDVTQSALAKSIRKRAKELLKIEAKNA